LSGWKRSGKDTVADYLVGMHSFKRIAFADPLKNTVALEFGITRSLIDDPATKESPLLQMPVNPKDRYSLMIARFMYREFRSADGQTPESCGEFEGPFVGVMPQPRLSRDSRLETLYWTPRALCILKGSTMRSVDPDYWVKQAVAQAQPGGLYVISDLRYVNEARTLKSSDARIITIRINRFETSPSQDPSECDLDDYKFDYVFNNKTSLEQLLLNTKNILNDLFLK